MQQFIDDYITVDLKGHKKYIILFITSLFIDLLSALLFHGFSFQWTPIGFRTDIFFGSMSTFEHTGSDLFLMSLLRLLLVPPLIIYGISKSSAKQYQGAREAKFLEPDREEIDLVIDPEHSNGDLKKKKKKNTLLSDNVDDVDIVTGSVKIKISSLEEEAEDDMSTVKQKERNRNIILAVLFIILTIFQIVLGIKGIKIQLVDNAKYNWIGGALLFVQVLCINVELYLATHFMTQLTKETGLLHNIISSDLNSGLYLPIAHLHPLMFTDSGAGRFCNSCRKRGLHHAYRCDSCHYDLCMDCAKKKYREKKKKGNMDETPPDELSDIEYLKKAAFLVKKDVILIIAAFVFLLASTITTLLLPSYQGKILDHVIHQDNDGFINDIRTFVIFNVLLGVLKGMRSICFSLIGRRVQYTLRDVLYESILRQDISFFDTTTTGDLTSRLNWNVNTMVSPINTLLVTVISSILQLIGGLFMCLNTSWRLSVLAFTTIGPVTLLLNKYSGWSSSIYKEISAYLGDASTLATQAITNIRTVRAFSQEPHELSQYKKATSGALNQGIKDAIVSSGTNVLTTYLEELITVLLLWYGGSVAMNYPSQLSVGSLITFQLYWNMMNNSWNSLTSVWNEFTRAAGASERVVSLLEAKPAINNDQGTEVNKVEGNMEVKNVHFYYGTRPNQKVLSGINLNIESGKVCALVGKSGGGKSTLIHLLMRFYDPTDGEILLDGYNITNLSKNVLLLN